MSMTRRNFLGWTSGAMAGAWLTSGAIAEGTPKFRLSVCDWSLKESGPAAMDVAKRLGLHGVEVSAGTPTATLKIANPAYRAEYKAAVEKTGIVVSSVAMGFLNSAPFATDERASAWMEQTIEATKDLNAKVILLAFFGKGDLRRREKRKYVLKTDEVDAVVERLKVAAPIAEKAGMILGLENTLSGKDNLAILDRVQSDAVRIYYDVGNSTYNGYDVPAELRDLGDRICQIHFKDGGYYLGQGKVDMDAVAKAMSDINYKGWVVLETAVRDKDRDASFAKNAKFVKELLGMKA
jgi:L-ribulose-5-phosphate 3-epimerase